RGKRSVKAAGPRVWERTIRNGGKVANLHIVARFILAPDRMLKPGSIFVALCMVAVAASVAAILVVGLGMRMPIAIAGGIGGVTVIAVVNRLVTQGGSRPATLRFFELEERIGLIAERVLTLEPRLAKIDQQAQDTARRAHAPIEKEIGELATLVRALAEQVETHEAVLAELPVRQVAWTAAELAKSPGAAIEEDLYGAPEPEPAHVPDIPDIGRGTPLDPGKAKLIRRAIETDGIELHLQPIASLPQRRVIQYSAIPYLRDPDGVLQPPSEYIADARLAGLVPALDAFVLDRALRVARRLKAREREITLTVDLSAETLAAPNFATDIAKRLDSNADLATHIVIGFSQDALFG